LLSLFSKHFHFDDQLSPDCTAFITIMAPKPPTKLTQPCLAFANSLNTNDIPEHLQCAQCHHLATNAMKLVCSGPRSGSPKEEGFLEVVVCATERRKGRTPEEHENAWN
jgi:hypothetical protein